MTPFSASKFPDLVSEAATKVLGARSPTEVVQAIVDASPITVLGFDDVSVTLQHRDGRLETQQTSSELVAKLDQIQYDQRIGPCLEALRTGEAVVVEEMRHEQRWPEYVQYAIEAGIHAQMGIPLRQFDNRSGGGGAMNLYKTTPGPIDPEAVDAAQMFGLFAASALGWRRSEEQLNTALATRKVIGTALGILMERYQINEAKAFDFLVRVSSTGNIKLREVALELVTQTDARYSGRKDD